MEWITIAQWAKNNDKTVGAARHAAKSVTADNRSTDGKQMILASTPWPFAPRKGGWTKGKARKVPVAVEA